MVRLVLLAALDRNRAIGKDNALPWHLPDDLKRFKRLTLGHPVVMGRRTYESIGRPLPGRTNIVVTRDRGLAIPGTIVVHSLDEALAAAGGASELFVIGGEQIYALALPHADRLELTEIDTAIAGDAWFPEWDRTAFGEIARESHTDAATGFAFSFVTYDRRRDD
ncbi:MAG: dihydrofolate reductase [Burkholderiales bacterium]|jgi:dihydrofolate reductase|nr:dihydrofolate reductase [Burkholderiales bacterium]